MGEFIEPRKITSEAAAVIAKALFAKAGPAGLEVQLAYFRGDGDEQSSSQPRQFQVSTKWHTTPGELARAIAALEHWPGWTQHCRVLRHAVAEAEKAPVHALVIVSDAFEEWTPQRPGGDDLVAARVHARRLHDLGVKIFTGYKGTIRGGCPIDRAGVIAEQAFRDITDENEGACFLFNPTNLAKRFGEIAAQAELATKGDAVGAKTLLEHLRAVPFDMTVGEREPSSRCEQLLEKIANNKDTRST